MIISENDMKAEPKQQFNITTRNSRNIWGLITNCKCSINGCKCFKLLDIPSYNTVFVILKIIFMTIMTPLVSQVG